MFVNCNRVYLKYISKGIGNFVGYIAYSNIVRKTGHVYKTEKKKKNSSKDAVKLNRQPQTQKKVEQNWSDIFFKENYDLSFA